MTPVVKRPTWQGVGFTFLLNIGTIVTGPLVILLWPFIGVTQLLYVLPLTLRFKKRDELEFVKGMWIGAGIVFLLNASCYGVLFLNPPSFR